MTIKERIPPGAAGICGLHSLVRPLKISRLIFWSRVINRRTFCGIVRTVTDSSLRNNVERRSSSNRVDSYRATLLSCTMTLIAEGDSTSDGMKSGRSGKHALVIPLSFQAHVAGIYRHVVQLAERGVTVTFVSLAQDVQQLETYDDLQGLNFHLLSYDPSFTHPKKVQTFWDVEAFTDDSGKHFQPILADLKAKQKAGLPGPTCIIFDRFCSLWVNDAAKELNLPMYTFFSCGAILARFFQVAPGLFSDGTLVIREIQHSSSSRAP